MAVEVGMVRDVPQIIKIHTHKLRHEARLKSHRSLCIDSSAAVSSGMCSDSGSKRIRKNTCITAAEKTHALQQPRKNMHCSSRKNMHYSNREKTCITSAEQQSTNAVHAGEIVNSQGLCRARILQRDVVAVARLKC